MKITNVRVCASIKVEAKQGEVAATGYSIARGMLGKKDRLGWPHLKDTDAEKPFLRRQLEERRLLPGFTAHIIKYDYPFNSKKGLDRRRALSIIRKAGFVAPTILQTFRLAFHTIGSGEIAQAISTNESRRVMSTVAINKEEPCFYYFGLGDWHKGPGTFRKMEYLTSELVYGKKEKGNNLYFADFSSVMFVYNFPLLIGIES